MKKYVKGVLLAGGLALFSSGLQAGTVLIGDGIEWTWSSADVGKASGSLTLNAKVAGSTLGDVRLGAFQLKQDSGFTVGSASVDGGGWTFLAKELNAGNCSGGQSKSSNLCFDANDIGKSLSDAADFSLKVNFAFSSGVLPDVLHLKVSWNEYDPKASFYWEGEGRDKVKVYVPGWNKVGSLISDDFARLPPPPPPPNDVPAPGALVLLGMGLAGILLGRRRRAGVPA